MIKYYNKDLINDIELVIFDMDGLMIDTERLVIEGYKYAGSKLGYNITKDIAMQTIGLNVEKTKQIISSNFDKNFNFDEIKKLQRQHLDEYVEKHGMPKKEGIIELLDFLDNMKIQKAVATSTAKDRAEKCLQSAKIDKRFNTIIYGDMIENGKPAPDIFLKASKICNIPPEKCMVLEDSPYGILAASRAEMVPVMIPDLIQPNEETEKLLFAKCDSLLDVINILSNV